MPPTDKERIELDKLRGLQEMGYMSREGEQRMAELIGKVDQRPSPRPAAPAPQEAPAPELPYFVPLNTDSFERGGQQFYPPAQPGIYPAVCRGTMVPSNSLDQLWFIFEGSDNAFPFRGALVTGALTATGERSGAFKVKEVFEALGVSYRVEQGKGVYHADPMGSSCKVSWDWVEAKGKRELRIQNVYPATAHVEQAV